MFFHKLVPSQVLMHGLRTTKETIQPNNKAPRRTLLFGPFVSFVMTVPAKRPHNTNKQTYKITYKILPLHVLLLSSTRSKPPVASRQKVRNRDGASSFADETIARTEVVRPPWQMLKTNDALPPRALTVTSVTQSHDLQVIN